MPPQVITILLLVGAVVAFLSSNFTVQIIVGGIVVALSVIGIIAHIAQAQKRK